MEKQNDQQEWVRACPANDVRTGNPKGLKVRNIPIALYRLPDGVYATHDVCTHAYALLSEGFIDEHVVECPLHGAKYDVRNGKCLAIADCDVLTYPVRIHDDDVYVALPAGGSAQ
ncbi:non-heme iron oxygenase ferredoxin subunit [Cupriavidus oxalaticus]|uniref:non-heme iron oxygenase ferredoxin subunit n=1 Tax=Cupriavidus oxalaticus TaxID=96344 RepID=UPI0040332263